MNKVWLPSLLFICLILASCNNPTTEELEPPEPTFTVDGDEVSYKRGTYSWSNDNRAINADSPAPPHLVENMDDNKISSNTTLEITFDYVPSKMEGGIWQNNGNDLTPITNNTLNLPKEPHSYTYVIRAYWEEGDAIYAAPFDVQ